MIEAHPFEPFLPGNAKILMLGSFPPQEKRWSIRFYYPNFGNDMWRIIGLAFFGEREYFTIPAEKKFNLEKIVRFCAEKGIAMFDTATAVRRLKDNASDKFLEVVVPTDITALLERLPECKAVVTTGQKATDVLTGKYGCEEPKVGEYVDIAIGSKNLRFYRMPSSSRAYPLSLAEKTKKYSKLFREIGLL